MADLVIQNVDPRLADRIRNVATARGWTFQKAAVTIIERGLFQGDYEVLHTVKKTEAQIDALADAINELKNLPKGTGF